mgnify:CR=1 FL=1
MTKNIAIYRTFGSNLRKYRNQRGLSQRELFSLCGIDNGMLSRMENGQINVTLNTLSILATTLEVSCWELLITTDDDQV